MVKYSHCEKCKDVYNTETWIGVVHIYKGICPSCMEEEQQENQIPQEVMDTQMVDKHDTVHPEKVKTDSETTQTSPIEIDKNLLFHLEQKANDVLSSKGSIDVLIKEIKSDLVEKAREKIEETFESFDVNKIDAQKVVDYAENILDYLSEYKNYMDCVVQKLQNKPKMKVKTAIDKVLKESMANIQKDVAKDVFLNKKEVLKTVSDKAVKWYKIYSDTKNTFELTKKMVLHPFTEIQKNLCTLPFYASS